jgi:hypothetical protein
MSQWSRVCHNEVEYVILCNLSQSIFCKVSEVWDCASATSTRSADERLRVKPSHRVYGLYPVLPLWWWQYTTPWSTHTHTYTQSYTLWYQHISVHYTLWYQRTLYFVVHTHAIIHLVVSAYQRTLHFVVAYTKPCGISNLLGTERML